MGLMQKIAETQVWRSIFRHGYPSTPRNRALAALSNVFAEVWMFWGVCPSYLGFVWTYCYASQTRRPLDTTPAADVHRTLGSRYYSADVHRASFALPPFVQACLPEGHHQRQ